MTKEGRQVYDAHELFHENLVEALVNGFAEGEQVIVSQALKNLQIFIEKYKE